MRSLLFEYNFWVTTFYAMLNVGERNKGRVRTCFQGSVKVYSICRKSPQNCTCDTILYSSGVTTRSDFTWNGVYSFSVTQCNISNCLVYTYVTLMALYSYTCIVSVGGIRVQLIWTLVFTKLHTHSHYNVYALICIHNIIWMKMY